MVSAHSKLTNDDIKKIADLIKIRIPEEELGDFRDQLDTALDSTEVFEELEIEEVDETSTSVGTINVFRDDIASGNLTQEEALQNAAFVQDGFIVVQRVVQK